MSMSARARLNHGLREAKNVCALTKVGTGLKAMYNFFFFFYVKDVFPAQAEYSYFFADFRLKIFLYYS